MLAFPPAHPLAIHLRAVSAYPIHLLYLTFPIYNHRFSLLVSYILLQSHCLIRKSHRKFLTLPMFQLHGNDRFNEINIKGIFLCRFCILHYSSSVRYNNEPGNYLLWMDAAVAPEPIWHDFSIQFNSWMRKHLMMSPCDIFERVQLDRYYRYTTIQCWINAPA